MKMPNYKFLQQMMLTSSIFLALHILGGCQSKEDKKFLELKAYEEEIKEANRLLSIEPFKSYLKTSPLIGRIEEGEKVMDHQSFSYDFRESFGFIILHHRPEGEFTNGFFADTLSSIYISIEEENILDPQYKKMLKELVFMIDSDFDFENFYVTVEKMEPVSDYTYPFDKGFIGYKNYHYRMKKRVASSFISIEIQPYSDRVLDSIMDK
ncbi:hypothetical protein QT711_18070 [Sporosarcina saromensis]|uniref:Lipoprotein n=1 Tax=Sporosarcina saromensis TaxID=359365 RepID=A0ABU4GDL1_9BACL|nr:hypothetical protein [Sporosarcina saromensis]MDW0115071.1 hypothetical protein [Sporosarcina saromensis]